MDSIHNKEICEMLHSMYIDSPILQETEELQDIMIDCNYSKVDVAMIVADLDINNNNKEQLRKKL